MFWEYSKKETKALLNATLLLFAAGALFIAHNWKAIEYRESLSASSVGIYAQVEETEINRLVAQLDKKEQELVQREAILLQQERFDREKNTLLTIALIGLSLLGLILLNFYLDTKRRRMFS